MTNKTEIKKKSQKHKVTNWHQYNNSLKRRGSLELWISSEIESIWYEANRINDGTGTPREYSDASIRLAYELKLCFKQPLRQLQGFINSIWGMTSNGTKSYAKEILFRLYIIQLSQFPISHSFR